jgi:hypothetical protein
VCNPSKRSKPVALLECARLHRVLDFEIRQVTIFRDDVVALEDIHSPHDVCTLPRVALIWSVGESLTQM